MTYLAFLLVFLGLPFVLLFSRLRAQLSQTDRRIIAGLSLIALLYTTPWDNYLVANKVWWYEQNLVTGLTIAWVPIEEYFFFIAQTVVTSLWLFFLLPRIEFTSKRKLIPLLRLLLPGMLIVPWVLSLVALWVGQPSTTYLGLELIWALPPIGIQLAFGADLLWRKRKLVTVAVLSATFFLSAADALAIWAGTWTINPEQSLNFLLFGLLPVEEFIFFLLTNTLIVFGFFLARDPESRKRLTFLANRIQSFPQKASFPS